MLATSVRREKVRIHTARSITRRHTASASAPRPIAPSKAARSTSASSGWPGPSWTVSLNLSVAAAWSPASSSRTTSG